ncbi:MAG TPA: hypothetical protein VFQ35_09545, partial [Polyangiaceae bacterium]|nr:hypothetical protein [Polyangiaceae bacterium]
MVKLSGFELFLPVSVTGADARTFMQGQLTNDLRKVTLERAVLAALCSPQGRVQTMVSVIERAEGLVLLLDRALASDVLSRVQAFTL